MFLKLFQTTADTVRAVSPGSTDLIEKSKKDLAASTDKTGDVAKKPSDGMFTLTIYYMYWCCNMGQNYNPSLVGVGWCSRCNFTDYDQLKLFCKFWK